jgi:hypothetical protein
MGDARGGVRLPGCPISNRTLLLTFSVGRRYDHGPEIRVEYDDFDLGNPWDVEPKTCEPCRRARCVVWAA